MPCSLQCAIYVVRWNKPQPKHVLSERKEALLPKTTERPPLRIIKICTVIVISGRFCRVLA